MSKSQFANALDGIEVSDERDIELENDRIKEKADSESRRIFEAIKLFDVPEYMRLEDYEAKYWPEGKAKAVEFVGIDDRNLIVIAKSGLGKTWLLVGIAIEKINQGKTAYRINELEYYQEWKKSNGYRNDRYYEMLNKAKYCDVLIFEEFGKNQLTKDRDGKKLTPFGGAVYLILDERYERKRQTLFNTQHDDENELIDTVGVTIYRRARMQMGKTPKCDFLQEKK